MFLFYRTFHPVDRTDDIIVFDHDGNNGDVSILFLISLPVLFKFSIS